MRFGDAHTATSRFRFTACGKTQIFVIPRRAARRGISLFVGLNQRGIPHFVRNDKINYFFRNLLSQYHHPSRGAKDGASNTASPLTPLNGLPGKTKDNKTEKT